MPWWYKNLASIIAMNFRCYPYISNGQSSSIQFIGLKEDVEIAKGVYLYAVETICYNCDKYVDERKEETTDKPQRIRNAYIFGFLSGLRDKFAEQIKQNQEWGLILVIDPEVNKKVHDMHLVKGRGGRVKVTSNAER